jgi:hypothetical protein
MSLILSGSDGLSDVDGSASTPAIRGTDANTGIFFGADTIAFAEGGTEVMRLDSSANLQFNSGYGSVATAYGCRAWVNFNGTSTVAIRASGNVTSITDNGTGDYTVNFTTAMPDANYCVNVSAPMYTTSNGSVTAKVYGSGTVGLAGLQSTTQIRVCWTDIQGTANFYDPANYYVAIFR